MFDERTLDFGGANLSVGVCDTENKRARGLMGVESMPHDCGMLFVMDEPGPVSFWMKNTLIPLDIVALDEQMNVLQVGSMEPHIGKFSCDGPVRYVVEANKGWCQAHGVGPGCGVMMNNDSMLQDLVESTLRETWDNPDCFGDIVFRPFSDMFFQKIREMKERFSSLNESNRQLTYDWFHREALCTDIGEFALYEGVMVPLDIPIPDVFHAEMFPQLHEATKKLPPNTKLNQPKRSGSGTKYHVYVRDPKTKNIKKVGFGAKGMGVGIHDPARVKSFKARHKCETRNDKTTASYWSCRLPRYWKSLGLKKTSSKWW